MARSFAGINQPIGAGKVSKSNLANLRQQIRPYRDERIAPRDTFSGDGFGSSSLRQTFKDSGKWMKARARGFVPALGGLLLVSMSAVADMESKIGDCQVGIDAEVTLDMVME